MSKRLFAIAVCVALSLTVAFGLVACTPTEDNGGAKFNYDITVWVGEGTKALTESMINKFNETNAFDVKFNATVREVSESKATGDIVAKPQSAPEIFCFAQDQFARLVKAKALSAPNSTAVAEIEANNGEDTLLSAKVGNTIYAYPLTTDNAYFLYYDKSVISDAQAGSLEDILARCEETGKGFSMGDGAWYIASFFYATGCKSEWTANEDGKFTAYDDTFDGAKGVSALKGLQKVLKYSLYSNKDKVSDFNASIKSGAVISGIWDYNEAKTSLGDNLGVAKLPSFSVDGQTYQMKSYLGCKFLGVSPQQDATKAVLLSKLALYLTNEQNQLARYEQMGWRPSNVNALKNEKVLSDATLTAMLQSATIPQGQYPADWWAQVEVMADSAKESESSDTALQSILDTYRSVLNGLLDQ